MVLAGMARIIERRKKAAMTFADALMKDFRDVEAKAAKTPDPDVCANDLLSARPRASDVVAALLLDAARADPLAMASEVTVVVASDPGLTEAVQNLLRVVWNRRLARVEEFLKHPSRRKIVLVVDRDVNKVNDWLPGVSENAGGIVQVTDDPEVVHDQIAAIAESPLVLPEMSSVAGLLSRVVEMVTGERVDAGLDDLIGASLAQISTALRPSMTAQIAVERLRALMKADMLREAAKTEKDNEVLASQYLEDVFDPAASAPVERVIGKLSETTGFGPAFEWGMLLAADLEAYKAGLLPWCDVDRGILLSGAPGSGKTSFARALALECNVPFFPSSFSSLVGGSATGYTVEKELKKLFEVARASAPCILFLDEMDSVPGRDFRPDHNSSYFNAVNNAFLEQLDGAVPRPGVVVIAATNYPERVDAALRRPGRLDRHITIPLPGVEALEGIIRHHLGQDAAIAEEPLKAAARACRGRSPAEIEQICRDARRTARLAKITVTAADVVAVLRSRRSGIARFSEGERRVAVHEAGHTVAAIVLSLPLQWVDLDKGVTQLSQIELPVLQDFHQQITMILAARAAEELILGQASAGCRMDLWQATGQAMELHTRLGLGIGGLVSFEVGTLRTDDDLYQAITATLNACYARALDLVRRHSKSIQRVADELTRSRYLDAEEVRALHGT